MRSRSCRYRFRAVGRAAGTLVLTWTTAVGAQTTATPSLNSHEIVAVRATKPPVIDGEIGEDEWKAAADRLHPVRAAAWRAV
jgi:hypothetical protein